MSGLERYKDMDLKIISNDILKDGSIKKISVIF